MKLYFAPGTCSLACWIALEWAEADYAVERVVPSSESYRKINPLGMVPAIDIGQERAMTQAGAILQYIAERFPHQRLGSGESLESKLEFQETMCFLTGDFHPAFWPFFSPQNYTIRTDTESLHETRLSSHLRVDRVMAHLDHLIRDAKGHVYAGRRSVADAYAFVMTRWTEHFPKTWHDYPEVASFMERMNQDPAVVAVLERSKTIQA